VQDVAHAGYGCEERGVEQPADLRQVDVVKTLHTAYRVSDLAASLDFYTALGYGQVGRIDIGGGVSLTVLKFPGEEVVTQVDNLAVTIEG
jgi:Glyoxalase/Bleomycin resistance protein/Dioxygenase superfamily